MLRGIERVDWSTPDERRVQNVKHVKTVKTVKETSQQ